MEKNYIRITLVTEQKTFKEVVRNDEELKRLVDKAANFESLAAYLTDEEGRTVAKRDELRKARIAKLQGEMGQ